MLMVKSQAGKRDTPTGPLHLVPGPQMVKNGLAASARFVRANGSAVRVAFRRVGLGPDTKNPNER
jgi:hypothetical protein